MKILADMWRYSEAINHLNPKDDPLFAKCINFNLIENDLDSLILAEFENRLLITFRGTKNLKAWISDAKAYPLKDDCEIHKDDGKLANGFHEGWMNYKSTILQYIKTMSSKPIFTIGHSRGGVIACICAGSIAEELKLPISCISFGSPAPGNKEYRNDYNLLSVNYTRVVHALDLVTHLPPDTLGFKHPGKEVQLKEAISWLPEFVRKILINTQIVDHYYTSYTKALLNYCKQEKDEEGVEAMKLVLKRAKP